MKEKIIELKALLKAKEEAEKEIQKLNSAIFNIQGDLYKDIYGLAITDEIGQIPILNPGVNIYEIDGEWLRIFYDEDDGIIAREIFPFEPVKLVVK